MLYTCTGMLLTPGLRRLIMPKFWERKQRTVMPMPSGCTKNDVREAVAKLFRATSDDKKLCFVKEEVFGITDRGPIIGPNHPVMLEMFAQPITDAL